MSYISGWFEGECGAVMVKITNVEDVEALAGILYATYGADCAGVDMELEGEFSDGSDIGDVMGDLWSELSFLTQL